jgi:hypothetical protein
MTPVEEQRATCKHCGNAIIWYFDRDDEARIEGEYGFWYDAETMIEGCFGVDGTHNEDLWHEPE